MSDQHDGGPAFPVSPDEARGKVSSVHGGLTIRDYFAGLTLGNPDIASQVSGPGWKQTLAEMCYEMADAMLEARKQPDQTEATE